MENIVSRPQLLLWEEIVCKEKKLDQSQGREKKDFILPLMLFTQSHSVSVHEATPFLPQLILHKFQGMKFIPFS